jgi:hypothetical protein
VGTPDADLAVRWMAGVYANCPPDAWVNVFSQTPNGAEVRSAWAQVARLGDLRRDIHNMAQTGHVWFSVALRRRRLPGAERGGVAECTAIPALWVDVDVDDGTGAHRLGNLPKTYDSAREVIDTMPYQPSAVVHSGHGLQAWWLLAEPLGHEDAMVLLQRWQRFWAAVGRSRGLQIDPTADLPRMMRLPGTVNYKAAPVMATYNADWGTLYQPGDFDDVLPDFEPEPERTTRDDYATAHLPGSKFDKAYSCVDVLEWKGCTLTAQEGQQSHWHWPGASNLRSFTVYEDGHAACWSQTAADETGIPLRQGFTSFGLWTWLFHGGDFAAASAAYRLKLENQPKPLDLEQVEPNATLTSEATPMNVVWNWPGWLPRGKLITLDGDPAVGKSTLVIDLVARITRGSVMPDGSESTQGHCILLAAEDDLEDTVVWRLMAAGADLRQVTYVRDMPDGGPVTLPRDVYAIEAMVRRTGAVLVVVDVLFEYLGEDINSYQDASVRRGLAPLRAMAARTSCSVLMLRHWKKQNDGKAMYQGGGSIGVVGAARAGWAVGFHPEDDTLRVLAPVKMNLAQRPDALGFRLVAHDVYPCAYVAWTGPVSLSADAMAAGAVKSSGDPDEESQVDFCARILAQVIDDNWRWTDEVYTQVAEWKFAEKTLKRARKVLNVEARQFGPDGSSGHERGWKIRRDT